MLPQAQRSNLSWIAIGLGVAALAVIIWVLLLPPRLTPPPVHIYDGENIRYELRRGTYVQVDETRTASVGLAEYSLELNFDKQQISPMIGSSLKGTIQLLNNGVSVDQMPESLWSQVSKSETPTPRVYLKTYGVYGWGCSTYQPQMAILGETESGQLAAKGLSSSLKTDWDACGPTTKYISIKRYKTPDLSSYIYSPQAIQVLDEKNNLVSTYLDLSQGQAEFEFVYQGGRYAPYLEFEIFNSLQQDIYTRKIVPFQDQKQSVIDVADPTIQKGRINYQVEFSSEALTAEQEETIRIDITALDSATGEVHDLPYQRVKVWAYPLAYYVKYTQRSFVPFDSLFVEKGILEQPGEFIGDLTNGKVDDAIVDSNNRHKTLLYDKGEYIEADLIDGKTSVYFKYNGKYRQSPHLAFVVQPANYDYEYTIEKLQKFGGDVFSGKQFIYPAAPLTTPRYSTEMPPRPDWPDDIEDIEFLKGIDSDYVFLYEQWQRNDAVVNENYSVTTLPIKIPKGTAEKINWLFIWRSWMWLVAPAIAAAVGLILFYIARRRKVNIFSQRGKRIAANPRIGHLSLLSKRGVIAVAFVAAAAILVFAMVVNYDTSLAELPDAGLKDSFPPANQQQAGPSSGYRLDISFENDILNPYPGGISKGVVRVLDANGQILPVDGTVSLVEGVIDFDFNIRETRPVLRQTDRRSNYGEIRGLESIRREIIDPAVIELVKEENNSAGILEGILENNTDLIGGDQAADAVRDIIGTLTDIIDEYYVIPVEVKPSTDFWEPGCSVDVFSGRVKCSEVLLLHNGVAEFEYISHGVRYPYTTFSVMAREVPSQHLKIYNQINYESYAPGLAIDNEEAASAYRLASWGIDRDFRQYQEDLARNDYSLPPASVWTLKSVPFGRYQDFTPPLPADDSIQTKVDYYYEIKSSVAKPELTEGNRFQITIVPRALAGRSVPSNISNRAILTILPSYDPVDDNSDDATDVKIYAAKLAKPGSGELVEEIKLVLTDKPVTVDLEFTGEASILPYLKFNLKVFGVEGYPEYMKFDDQIYKDSIPQATLNTVIRNQSPYYRVESPEIMTISASVPLRTANLWGVIKSSDVYHFGWWFIASQIIQILAAGMMIIIFRKRRRSRPRSNHEKEK